MIRKCIENGSCSFAKGFTIEEAEINLNTPGEMKRKKTEMLMALGVEMTSPNLVQKRVLMRLVHWVDHQKTRNEGKPRLTKEDIVGKTSHN